MLHQYLCMGSLVHVSPKKTKQEKELFAPWPHTISSLIDQSYQTAFQMAVARYVQSTGRILNDIGPLTRNVSKSFAFYHIPSNAIYISLQTCFTL